MQLEQYFWSFSRESQYNIKKRVFIIKLHGVTRTVALVQVLKIYYDWGDCEKLMAVESSFKIWKFCQKEWTFLWNEYPQNIMLWIFDLYWH